MAITAEHLHQVLHKGIKYNNLIIQDITNPNCGTSFNIYMCSPTFDSLNMVKRHRMVYSILENEMPNIHALTLKLWSTEEWPRNSASIPTHLLNSDYGPSNGQDSNM
uniref:BolA-like protein 2 n=2 Tax=Lygus hesperus TaxID=30085 RepID=A0A0A9WWQ6_LYGHE